MKTNKNPSPPPPIKQNRILKWKFSIFQQKFSPFLSVAWQHPLKWLKKSSVHWKIPKIPTKLLGTTGKLGSFLGKCFAGLRIAWEALPGFLHNNLQILGRPAKWQKRGGVRGKTFFRWNLRSNTICCCCLGRKLWYKLGPWWRRLKFCWK